jgi:hypothetical protein
MIQLLSTSYFDNNFKISSPFFIKKLSSIVLVFIVSIEKSPAGASHTNELKIMNLKLEMNCFTICNIIIILKR